MINREDIKKLIEGHSFEFTTHHIYQELAELMVAVSKAEIAFDSYAYDDSYKDAIAEEMADAVIMLEIIKELYSITDGRLESEVKNKMKKNLRRVDNGKK